MRVPWTRSPSESPTDVPVGSQALVTNKMLRHSVDCKPPNAMDAVCLTHRSKPAQMSSPVDGYSDTSPYQKSFLASKCSHSNLFMPLEGPLLIFYGQTSMSCLLRQGSLKSETTSYSYFYLLRLQDGIEEAGNRAWQIGLRSRSYTGVCKSLIRLEQKELNTLQ